MRRAQVDSGRRTTGRAAWVPVAAMFVTAAVMAWVGYHGEASYEQDDPGEQGIAAALFSFPFLLLALVQTVSAVGLLAARARAARVACVALATVGPVLLAALVLWLYSRNESAKSISGVAVLSTALLLPLLPVWVAVVAERSGGAGRGRRSSADQADEPSSGI